MFSSLTLRNCAFSQEDEQPLPITLKASVSFPSRRQNYYGSTEPTASTWAAHPVTDGGHLDITLGSDMIGEGRRGLVYPAQINTGIDASGQNILADWPPELPHTLCVKIANPRHCRALAREACFYEQLHEVQGIATARCYGLYTIALQECDNGTRTPIIRPWTHSDEYPYNMETEDEEGLLRDRLPDDGDSVMYTDEHGFKRNSSWNNWRPSEEAPLLTVLVLEKLGRHYYFPDEEVKHDFATQR